MLLITVRVFKPKKSNFINPAFSAEYISNCVDGNNKSADISLYNGTTSDSFLSAITGTEDGVDEPVPSFSACFGAPFMPLHPTVYAKMLIEKMSESGVDVWLVNTGWTGGPHGVGEG